MGVIESLCALLHLAPVHVVNLYSRCKDGIYGRRDEDARDKQAEDGAAANEDESDTYFMRAREIIVPTFYTPTVSSTLTQAPQGIVRWRVLQTINWKVTCVATFPPLAFLSRLFVSPKTLFPLPWESGMLSNTAHSLSSRFPTILYSTTLHIMMVLTREENK
jgi:hypothetical protein